MTEASPEKEGGAHRMVTGVRGVCKLVEHAEHKEARAGLIFFRYPQDIVVVQICAERQIDLT
jgi:hypothetical protein